MMFLFGAIFGVISTCAAVALYCCCVIGAKADDEKYYDQDGK